MPLGPEGQSSGAQGAADQSPGTLVIGHVQEMAARVERRSWLGGSADRGEAPVYVQAGDASHQGPNPKIKSSITLASESSRKSSLNQCTRMSLSPTMATPRSV